MICPPPLYFSKPWWRSCRLMPSVAETSPFPQTVRCFRSSAIVSRYYAACPQSVPSSPHARLTGHWEHFFLSICFSSPFFPLSHELLGFSVSCLHYRSWKHDEDLEEENTPHPSISIPSAAVALQRIMQHLKPWRALLLLTVLYQPAVSEKYGKVMMMMIVTLGLSEFTPLWYSHSCLV